MKTDEQRKQQIANALNGLTSADAIAILREIKSAIKYRSKVAFEKDCFTKDKEPIKFAYRTNGALEQLIKYTIENIEETPK